MDGRAIFEKSKQGRHPDPGEVLARIAAGQKGEKEGK
jgi:hypothetical protein